MPELLMIIISLVLAVGGLGYFAIRVTNAKGPITEGKVNSAQRMAAGHPSIRPRIKQMLDDNGGFLTNRNYATIYQWWQDMNVANSYESLHETISRKVTS